MLNITRTLALVVATSLLGPGLALAQGTQDRDRVQTRDPTTHVTDPDRPFEQRDRDQTYLRLRDRIKLDAKLDAAQVQAIEPDLWRYHTRQGDHLRLRTLAQQTAQSSCGGDCLRNSVQLVNQAMQRGATDKEAVQMCGDALRTQVRARDRLRTEKKLDPQQLQARVQQDFEKRLTSWQQERERARQAKAPATKGEQARDQARDRANDQERDRAKDQERDRTRDRTPK